MLQLYSDLGSASSSGYTNDEASAFPVAFCGSVIWVKPKFCLRRFCICAAFIICSKNTTFCINAADGGCHHDCVCRKFTGHTSYVLFLDRVVTNLGRQGLSSSMMLR